MNVSEDGVENKSDNKRASLTPKKGYRNLNNSSLKQRITPLINRTRNGRARGANALQVNSTNEILILRAENRTLKTSVENLQRTLSQQSDELTEFRAELKFLQLDLKKTSQGAYGDCGRHGRPPAQGRPK